MGEGIVGHDEERFATTLSNLSSIEMQLKAGLCLNNCVFVYAINVYNFTDCNRNLWRPMQEKVRSGRKPRRKSVSSRRSIQLRYKQTLCQCPVSSKCIFCSFFCVVFMLYAFYNAAVYHQSHLRFGLNNFRISDLFFNIIIMFIK